MKTTKKKGREGKREKGGEDNLKLVIKSKGADLTKYHDSAMSQQSKTTY